MVGRLNDAQIRKWRRPISSGRRPGSRRGLGNHPPSTGTRLSCRLLREESRGRCWFSRGGGGGRFPRAQTVWDRCGTVSLQSCRVGLPETQLFLSAGSGVGARQGAREERAPASRHSSSTPIGKGGLSGRSRAGRGPWPRGTWKASWGKGEVSGPCERAGQGGRVCELEGLVEAAGSEPEARRGGHDPGGSCQAP